MVPREALAPGSGPWKPRARDILGGRPLWCTGRACVAGVGTGSSPPGGLRFPGHGLLTAICVQPLTGAACCPPASAPGCDFLIHDGIDRCPRQEAFLSPGQSAYACGLHGAGRADCTAPTWGCWGLREGAALKTGPAKSGDAVGVKVYLPVSPHL